MFENPKYHGQENKDAVALAIGKIVMAWNEFHELLAETYAEICGRDKWRQSLDEWQRIPNDRAQRMKLLEAARFNLTGRALEETIWVVENTDALIANQRNIGVHSHLCLSRMKMVCIRCCLSPFGETSGPSLWSAAICWVSTSISEAR